MKVKDVRKIGPHHDRLVYWINEREAIRLRKEAGKPQPWTDDEILSRYRFCNVRRMDDRVSRWLYSNWYLTHLNDKMMLTNVALARFINKIDTLAHIGYQDKWKPAELSKKLRRYRDDGNTVFGAAYVVRGNDGMDKIESVVDYYVDPLVDSGKDWRKLATSFKDFWKFVLPFYGMGSFMAGQITADMRWACPPKGDKYWVDRFYWAPMGPGSKRGMNRLHGRPIKAKLNDTQFEPMLISLVQFLMGCLPVALTSRLEGIDYQNCLCEFDKYERALWDEGKPKQLYKPANQ